MFRCVALLFSEEAKTQNVHGRSTRRFSILCLNGVAVPMMHHIGTVNVHPFPFSHGINIRTAM